MTSKTLRQRMQAGDVMAGTFMKTPAHEVVEVLHLAGLDFICIDAEHAPFDRHRLDVCLAVARALGFETLVRVPTGDAQSILNALDCGATGIVIPHVDSVEKAQQVAKWSRYGHGGRGYAGSSRWAGFATRKAQDILDQSETETIVIAQIEEPEGVDAADEIAAIPGIDGLFVGPADLAVCYGTTDQTSTVVRHAMKKTAAAAKAHNKCCMTFVPNIEAAKPLIELGMSMFFVASEHSFMMAGARQTMDDLKTIQS